MNLSNALTVLRIFLLIPMGYFLSQDQGFWATVILTIAGISDGLDGYLARKLNQVSDFGKLMDPIADKIFVVVAFFLLVADPIRQLNPWLASVLIAREFFVSGLRSLLASQGVILAAEPTAKWKAAFQFIGIGGYLLYIPLFTGMPPSLIIGQIALGISLVLSYLSMFSYMKRIKFT